MRKIIQAAAVRRLGWRLLFVAGFLPLGIPLALWSALALAAAAVAWLLLGPDVRDGRDRTERWLLGRTFSALEWPLNKLMRKAGVLRELWT